MVPPFLRRVIRVVTNQNVREQRQYVEVEEHRRRCEEEEQRRLAVTTERVVEEAMRAGRATAAGHRVDNSNPQELQAQYVEEHRRYCEEEEKRRLMVTTERVIEEAIRAGIRKAAGQRVDNSYDSNPQEEKIQACTICFQKYEKGDLVATPVLPHDKYTPSCTHHTHFHVACITEWLDTRKKLPSSSKSSQSSELTKIRVNTKKSSKRKHIFRPPTTIAFLKQNRSHRSSITRSTSSLSSISKEEEERAKIKSNNTNQKSVPQTCGICLQEYAAEDLLAYSQNPECSHYFHADCIHKALLVRPRCPCCRRGNFHDSESTTIPSSLRYNAISVAYYREWLLPSRITDANLVHVDSSSSSGNSSSSSRRTVDNESFDNSQGGPEGYAGEGLSDALSTSQSSSSDYSNFTLLPDSEDGSDDSSRYDSNGVEQ